MSIELIEINGKSPHFDYEIFESSLKDTIGDRCSDAKVFAFNNFPVSVSVETNIDLILVIALDPRQGNYYRLRKNDRWVYLNNLIIPIKFITHLKNDNIEIEENQIVCNEEFIDYSTEINSIRFGLINYLANKCGLKKNELFIQPLIFIENDNETFLDNYLIAKTFNFQALNKYLLKWSRDIFISYKEWKTDIGYSNIARDIETITEQASKDSEIGYLTKKKIDRIGKQLASSKKIYEELNQNLVIINGKAGTGKSSELLLLTMQCISQGRNTLYLTYNKLLIFDIAKTVKSYINSRLSDKTIIKPGEGSVLTLMAFFYRLSKSLGVLHVLSAERIDKLLITLKSRMRLIYDFLEPNLNSETINFNRLKTEIQNAQTFDIATKEVGIDFLNFLARKGFSSKPDFGKYSIEFFEHKKRLVENIQANEVFLADYYGVLESTLLAIQEPDKYFEKYKLQDKYDLLEVVLNLKDKHIEKGENGTKIKEKGFTEQKNRKVGGHRRKRTLFIDEAQDCHRLEKEILISIYSSDNIVIANGGKEQLIRHVELCNWEVSQSKKISVKKHYTRNKSYRVKKTVVDFCNYVADRYKIDLNLEPLESEDEGELLIDFRQNHNETEIQEIFNQLSLKGEVHGCTPYERLLILLESNTQRTGADGEGGHDDAAIINEYGNIEDAQTLKRGTWKHLEQLEKHDYMFWDGTVGDKSQLIVPSPNESRLIYYESCRGLEAWAVGCFALDKFFNQKREDEDAEKYLIEDLFLNQDNEQRKSMYAATWALMALTRVIDTLYIQINDKDSEFGKIVTEYMNMKPKNVKELKMPVANKG